MTTHDDEFDKLVAIELNNLLVKEEAKSLLETTKLKDFDIPKGILASDPLPDTPPELIPGVLLAHGATGLVAQKEAGKTLCALEIQHCLLTGEPLWGVLKPNKIINKSVHFYAEHSCFTVLNQYKYMGLPPTDKLVFYGPEHLRHMRLIISSGVRRERAVSVYKKLAEGAGLVVFDPIAAFIQGEGAENDNAQMRHLVDSMIDIARDVGAACLILAHQGKPQMTRGEFRRRHSYAARGASAIEDALTGVLYLDDKEHSIGGRDLYQVTPAHFKGRKSKPFQLLRDRKTLRQTLLAEALKVGQ